MGDVIDLAALIKAKRKRVTLRFEIDVHPGAVDVRLVCGETTVLLKALSADDAEYLGVQISEAAREAKHGR
ncbi:MAG TPA: hypothetical protein VMY76_00795 [Gemmatimonadales bacterium]|nr:hypothetical protein [Gemmatimonadales bacterium]